MLAKQSQTAIEGGNNEIAQKNDTKDITTGTIDEVISGQNEHKANMDKENKSVDILDPIDEENAEDSKEDDDGKGEEDKDIFTDASQGDMDDKEIPSDKLNAEDSIEM